jgi:hypothetical protein
MDLLNDTLRQIRHELPPIVQNEAMTIATLPRNDLVSDFTTRLGKHLEIHIPQTLFDTLCEQLSNDYKAGCWVAARCSEVDTLSAQAIERYVNMMTHAKLGLKHDLSSTPCVRIAPSPLWA